MSRAPCEGEEEKSRQEKSRQQKRRRRGRNSRDHINLLAEVPKYLYMELQYVSEEPNLIQPLILKKMVIL